MTNQDIFGTEPHPSESSGTTGPITLAGDVAGPSNANIVEAVQGIPYNSTPPSTGQFYEFDGTQMTPVSGAIPPSMANANTVYAGPAMGSPAAPIMRALVPADMPAAIPAINIGTGTVDNTELSYLDGVTSSIQTQLNTKSNSTDVRFPPTPSGAGKMVYDTGSAYAELSAGTSSQVLVGGNPPAFGNTPTAALPIIPESKGGYGSDISGIGTGLISRTAANTYAARTLTPPAAGIAITNGGGVLGDPTLSLANDLAAIEGLSSTGIAVRTGTDAWAQRSIIAGTGTTVTNGNGVSGNLAVNVTYGSTSSTATQGNDTRLAPSPSGAGKMVYDTGSAYAELAAGTTSQVLVGGTTPAFGLVPFAAFPTYTDIQTITTPGTNTWTKPSSFTPHMTFIFLIGAGGGGGSGARNTTASGGAGGAGGGVSWYMIPTSLLNNTETVVIGTGGTGGAAQTVDSTNGVVGTAGGDTIFRHSGTNWVKAQGGGPGAGGTGTTATGGTAGTTSLFVSAAGGQGTTSTGGVSGVPSPGAAGAGGGGGGTSAGSSSNGGLAIFGWGGSGSGGVAPGGAGNSGLLSLPTGTPGGGGSGGASAGDGVTPGGAGGNGGIYGGGGGGGGASANGANSGKGGDGANGIAIIMTW